MYSKKEIGIELQKQLEKKFDVTQIAHWAYSFFFNHRRELSDEMEELLEYLFFMEEGAQFEYSEFELKLLAKKLINNEENPIKQINDLKTKESG